MKVSASLPPFATTALYFTSFVLQNSASLRFFGTFISGALPLSSTTPLTVAVPIAPPGPVCAALDVVVGAALAVVVVGGLAAVLGFAEGVAGLVGSSGQPTPIVSAVKARAASEAKSRPC